LENGLLLAYLDGALDVATQAELEAALAASPVLRAELAQLAQLRSTLDERLNTDDAPSPQLLGEYVLGLLPPAEAAAVAEQLASHPHAAQQAAALAAYLADVAPPAATPAAGAPAADQPGWVEQWAGQVTTLLARLVEGLGGGPTLGLAGVRGEESSRQVYQAGDTQIMLEVQPSPAQNDRRDILGLVTGLRPEGSRPERYRADLYRRDELVASAAVDRLGNFVLAAVTPGDYGLVLDSADQEIAVPFLRVE
jgi:anti-sigma factor RsiW